MAADTEYCDGFITPPTYYQIEDISDAGERKRLATVRLKGFVSASGKLMTKWADLKDKK